MRLSGAPEQSAKQIGQATDPAAAASAAGAAAGQRLASVGLNVNLAPVLDVYRQDGDFLDQAAPIKAVANLAVGTDNIDLDAAKQMMKYTTAANTYISTRRPSRCATFDAAPRKSVIDST